MAVHDDETEVHRVATAVFEAFQQLAQDREEVIGLFHSAFTERAKNPSLFESKGQKGLMFALTKLLWSIPEKSYFSTTRSYNEESASVDQFFSENFQTALQDLTIECPGVLLSMRRHLEERGYSYTDLLRALFLFYHDNKDVDPYF